MTALVVAGVSGSGKSTVGSVLAGELGWAYADGDRFHPDANIAKMSAGDPLDDQDREPWLRSIGAWIDRQHRDGADAVVSCSALRAAHRSVLARPWLLFCVLEVPASLLRDRLTHRSHHFMPSSLLASQLATYEPLGPEEAGFTVDASGTPQDVVRTCLTRLRDQC